MANLLEANKQTIDALHKAANLPDELIINGGLQSESPTHLYRNAPFTPKPMETTEEKHEFFHMRFLNETYDSAWLEEHPGTWVQIYSNVTEKYAYSGTYGRAGRFVTEFSMGNASYQDINPVRIKVIPTDLSQVVQFRCNFEPNAWFGQLITPYFDCDAGSYYMRATGSLTNWVEQSKGYFKANAIDFSFGNQGFAIYSHTFSYFHQKCWNLIGGGDIICSAPWRLYNKDSKLYGMFGPDA